MRAVVQRVTQASVSVAGRELGRIETSLLVLLGVAREDRERDAEVLADKILGLRIFADAEGKMNLALKAVGGELLVISQSPYWPTPKAAAAPHSSPRRRPTRRARSTSVSSRYAAARVLRSNKVSSGR